MKGRGPWMLRAFAAVSLIAAAAGYLGVEYGIPAEFIGGRWPVCLEIKILH